jgi:hypothetical protein
MSPFWIILGIIAVLILAWNFIPAFRTRMRGYTTALEGSIFATIPFIGDAIDALSETEWKSFVPEWAWKYCFAAGPSGLSGSGTTPRPAWVNRNEHSRRSHSQDGRGLSGPGH